MIIALKYWREILIGVAICLLIAAAAYVKHVFTVRDQLQAENSILKIQLESAAKMMELTNKITEAIGQIKIRSSINVQRIESENKPVFVDSLPIVFIPGGVLQGVYSSGTAGRTTADHAGGGDMGAGQPRR